MIHAVEINPVKQLHYYKYDFSTIYNWHFSGVGVKTKLDLTKTLKYTYTLTII